MGFGIFPAGLLLARRGIGSGSRILLVRRLRSFCRKYPCGGWLRFAQTELAIDLFRSERNSAGALRQANTCFPKLVTYVFLRNAQRVPSNVWKPLLITRNHLSTELSKILFTGPTRNYNVHSVGSIRTTSYRFQSVEELNCSMYLKFLRQPSEVRAATYNVCNVIH